MSKQQENKATRDETAKVAAQKKKQESYAKLPMNQYLNSDLSMAKKLRTHLISGDELVRDDMRKVQSYIQQIRHRQVYTMKLKDQLKTSKFHELNNYGKVMTREEIANQIVVNELSLYHDLADIKDWLLQHLMIKIDGASFTAEMFDEFISRADKRVAELGLELFPDKLELIEIL